MSFSPSDTSHLLGIDYRNHEIGTLRGSDKYSPPTSPSPVAPPSIIDSYNTNGSYAKFYC